MNLGIWSRAPLCRRPRYVGATKAGGQFRIHMGCPTFLNNWGVQTTKNRGCKREKRKYGQQKEGKPGAKENRMFCNGKVSARQSERDLLAVPL